MLVGVEVDAAAAVGYNLIERLRGVNNSHLHHIMVQSPGAVVVLKGRGTHEAPTEPLFLYITSKVWLVVRLWRVAADSN